MDIRVLQNFLVVAQAENITRAAELLHISQPSLSRQLMDLEAELGRQLLIRGKRKLSLTEDGVLLRKRAEEIVALTEKTMREIGSDAAGSEGEISIGGWPAPRVLRAAAALRAAHSGVRFNFYGSDATDVIERLDHGSLDFAVLLEPVDAVKYEYLSLKDSFRWGLLMPDDCPLAAQPCVSREALRAVPLIMHRRAGLQRSIALWAQTQPERLNIAATYNVVNSSPAYFVRSGLGHLVVGEDHLDADRAPGVCFRPFEPPLRLHHALVWKRYSPLGRAAAAFLDEMRHG